MLRSKKELQCGLFDSVLQRKNKSKSPLRYVKNFELELFLENGGKSHINGEAFSVKRGMLLCARPEDLRYSDFPVKCRFIRLAPRHEEDPCQRLLKRLPTCLYLPEDKTETLIPLFFKLSAALMAADKEEDEDLLRINSLLFEILCRIKDVSDDKAAEKRPALIPAVRDAYEYINEHYFLDCKLETLAEAVHLTPNYLHTAFTRQVGKTPLAHRDEMRMQHACRLLEQGEKSFIQIALDTGFCSQSHFNRVFKKNLGMTPLQYQKQLLLEY